MTNTTNPLLLVITFTTDCSPLQGRAVKIAAKNAYSSYGLLHSPPLLQLPPCLLHFGTNNIICHSETADIIQPFLDSGDNRRPACTRTFSGMTDTELTVGNQTLYLSYKGRGHKPGNIFVWHEESKVLMIIDVVFPNWSPFRNLALADDPSNWFAQYDQVTHRFPPSSTPSSTSHFPSVSFIFLTTFATQPVTLCFLYWTKCGKRSSSQDLTFVCRQILEYPFEYVVGGHVTQIGDRKSVELGKEFMDDVSTAAANSLYGEDAVDFYTLASDMALYDPDSPYFLNVWALYNIYLEKSVDICLDEVLPKWIPIGESDGHACYDGYPRLAGVDVFARENCFSAIEAFRVDGEDLSGTTLARRSISANKVQWAQERERLTHVELNRAKWKLQSNRGVVTRATTVLCPGARVLPQIYMSFFIVLVGWGANVL